MNIVSLPEEIKIKILHNLNYDDIINYAKVCKSTFMIFKNKYFWVKKLDLDLRNYRRSPNINILSGFTKVQETPEPVLCVPYFMYHELVELFEHNDMLPCVRYKYITTEYPTFLSINTMSKYKIKNFLYEAMRNNDYSTINFLIKFCPLTLINLDRLSLLFETIIYHKVNVNTIKIMINYLKPDRDDFKLTFTNILKNIQDEISYGNSRGNITYNQHNYDIIEYILNNIKLDDTNLNLITLILLSFCFNEVRLKRLIFVTNYDVNKILSIIINKQFHISDFKCMLIIDSCTDEYVVSISFIKFLFNNYNFNENITKIFNEYLFKRGYIDILTLTQNNHQINNT